MTLEQDWVRISTAWKKLRDAHWNPKIFLFAGIHDLRKADNKSIDFAIRRLFNSEAYGGRIKLYGGPSSTYSRYPLRVTHRRLTGLKEYKYMLIGIPELYIKREMS